MVVVARLRSVSVNASMCAFAVLISCQNDDDDFIHLIKSVHRVKVIGFRSKFHFIFFSAFSVVPNSRLSSRIAHLRMHPHKCICSVRHAEPFNWELSKQSERVYISI